MFGIAMLLYLMGTHKASEFIGPQEVLERRLPEDPTDTSSIVGKKIEGVVLLVIHLRIFFFVDGVGPQEVAEGSRFRRFLEPIYSIDIGQGVERGANAAMEAQESTVGFCFDERGEGKGIKRGHDSLVDRFIVFHEGFLFKVEVFCDFAALVVSTEEGDAIGEGQLESEEKKYGFTAKHASINIVAQEEVPLAISDLSGIFEEVE